MSSVTSVTRRFKQPELSISRSTPRSRLRRGALAAAFAASLLAAAGCFDEGADAPLANAAARGGSAGTAGVLGDGGLGDLAGGGAGGEPTPEDPPTFTCDQAVAEPLPARLSVTAPDADGSGGGQTIVRLTKAQLFREFERQQCGTSACHGGADEPLLQSPSAFRMTLESFDDRPTLGSEALERILSSDPDRVMPPNSGDGSKRSPENPVRLLGERLLAWQEAGFPEELEIAVGGGPVNPDLPEDPYVLPPGVAATLTNIGSCIPRNASVLSLMEEEVAQKDALFASIATSEELPETIFETDLVSLDSAVLARRRVFSYAPTYTLFSDNAGKMRHVRVPLGETIRYDPEQNDFHIPDNTRFYKTFLKQVRDEDGNVGWRKMETRVIVVRNDEVLPDGSYRTRALRAAYAWDKDERMARRVKDPFRSGAPAADRLCPYVVDEGVERDPATNPISDDVSEFCTYMTPDELADPSSGRIRHYAIPSTERCDQCHMGSSSHSYILGFNPWQADRRRDGEGGVYEAPMADELSQLGRLLEYGVVSGIEPGQGKLEESQGERKPRNDYELKAQAYMIGNCAFCHTPHGFPVVQNPVLREFDLFPSETGGIFEFSLERYSPRARAGKSQVVRFPYITPAFGDHVLQAAEDRRNQDTKETTVPLTDPPVADPSEVPPEFDPLTGIFSFVAPWRSLIWRNVYTPFTYEEDGTIFIHMPRNAPGYDCRAQRIMADWMLSIPSVPKPDHVLARNARERDQPVMEATDRSVAPRIYREALVEAERRVEWYRNSVAGAQCPPDDDIVDPKVILSPLRPGTGRKERQVPVDDGYFSSPRFVPSPDYVLWDSVPDHAHWVPTDLTEPPGKWVPRRANWREVVVTREVPVSARLSDVIDDLQRMHLSPELEAFALEPVPMGTWAFECRGRPEVAESPLVQDLLAEDGEPLRRWLSGLVFAPDSRRGNLEPVHYQSRGEAVFRAICQNCHGKDADSKSPLAATVLEVTGGRTRVANFVAGLFGPASAPGAFARDEFLLDRGATPDEWMARYLLFMGLGGTEAEIPQIVLDLVATSPFYGGAVTAPGARNANMLGSAEQLCFDVLAHNRIIQTKQPRGGELSPSVRLEASGSIFATGAAHYELWESLCTRDNEAVVRVFNPTDKRSGPGGNSPYAVFRAKDDTGRWVYPPDHPVGNQNGDVEIGIRPENTLPWCVLAETEAEREAAVTFGFDRLRDELVPFCPPSLMAKTFDESRYSYRLALDRASRDADMNVPLGNQDFSRRWMRRGAMNAGLSAYYYLRGILTGELDPSLPFDFCRQ